MNRLGCRSALLVLLVGLFLSAKAGPGWLDGLIDIEAAGEKGWAGSTSCRTCHRDHHRTWHRTYHRTMTQVANERSIAGPFDGRVLDYWGQAVRPVRDGENYFFEYLDRNGRLQKRLPVERTVGSHRYQQYLTRHPEAGEGNYWRLPLLYHMDANRWIHVNAVFLGSDSQGFDSHLTLWNQNCIFCHNTGPRPGIRNLDTLMARAERGEPVDMRYEPRYQSAVAELGIACESCHSPGAVHAAANRNPLRRYALHLTGRDDPSIVNPAKLDQARSAAICGQCHAQRLPQPRERIAQWLRDGPSFRAGDRLEDHVTPIRQDTPPADPAAPDQFRLRFWSDGTPRLSAYEYQGLTQSACYTRGQITCISCHSGHRGEPEGMISESARSTNKPCLACHQDLADEPQAHTRHTPGTPGSLCYDCHMPKLAYGVMTLHRSHRIERPQPAANAAAGRPDACTNCHVDRSSDWADSALLAWRDGTDADAGTRSAMPRFAQHLLTGDPVQRALAARLAGELSHPGAQRHYLVPLLIITLTDRYPMLRWFARMSLLEIAPPAVSRGLAQWDFIAPAAQRQALVDEMWQRWAALDKSSLTRPHGLPLDDNLMPDWDQVRVYLSQRANKEIEIGE